MAAAQAASPNAAPRIVFWYAAAIQALRSVVMQLAPHTASSREPARRAETNVHLRAGGGARAPFTTDEQMPIVAALAGEIVEGHLDNRGPSEQFQIVFTDGLPTKPDAAHRVVHAGCVPSQFAASPSRSRALKALQKSINDRVHPRRRFAVRVP